MKKAAKIVTLAAAITLIPSAASADQYIVKSGDTLAKISQKYKMSLAELLEMNPHFPNPNLIHIGDRVNVTSSDIARDLVDYAMSLQDVTTYVYGGQTIDKIPLETDCSGWVQHVYRKFGIELPRVSRDQARVGMPVRFQDMRIGDLMFFSTRADKVITHVGIYMGDDTHQWISNLNSDKDVTILSTWGNWSQKYFLWAQRVI